MRHLNFRSIAVHLPSPSSSESHLSRVKKMKILKIFEKSPNSLLRSFPVSSCSIYAYLDHLHGAKHSPWIFLMLFFRGRGHIVNSDVPTPFYAKLFSGSNFEVKYSHWTKTLIQASNEFIRKTFLSFQIVPKIKKQLVPPTNFAKIKVQNVEKWRILHNIQPKFLSWRLSF